MVHSARDAVALFWDDVVRDALTGGEPHKTDPRLRRWFHGYRGAGRGAVTTVASPERYIGPLRVEHGMPRLIALGLNPGRADIRFQGPGGVFAREYERRGGFSAWAITEPYLREPWRDANGRNRYHENLRSFARHWLEDPSIRSRDVLVFELYPWHSDAATAAMAPDEDLIDEFIWQPISEIDATDVIAIGSDWQRVAQRLALREQPLDVSFTDPTRRARSFELRSGQRLVVTWHQASNKPPNARDARALRNALRGPLALAPIDPRPASLSAGLGEPLVVRQAPRPAGSSAYQLFWAQLTDRLGRDQPAWKIARPRGNDYPLFSPLPGSRVKCNFSRQGLRVELLMQSSDRALNLRRLEVLSRNLPDLQAASVQTRSGRPSPSPAGPKLGWPHTELGSSTSSRTGPHS